MRHLVVVMAVMMMGMLVTPLGVLVMVGVMLLVMVTVLVVVVADVRLAEAVGCGGGSRVTPRVPFCVAGHVGVSNGADIYSPVQ